MGLGDFTLRYLAIFFFLLSTILPGTAFAETDTVTVGANRTTPVAGFSIYIEENCYSGGKVDYKVSGKPKHGKVTVQYQRRKLGKSAGRCAGKPAGSMVILFTPDRGYRGKDKFTVSFYFDKFEGGGARRARNISYDVTVK